jgi:hypothetical protein
MASQARVNDPVPKPGGIFGGIRTGKIPQTGASQAIAGIFSFRPWHHQLFRQVPQYSEKPRKIKFLRGFFILQCSKLTRRQPAVPVGIFRARHSCRTRRMQPSCSRANIIHRG